MRKEPARRFFSLVQALSVITFVDGLHQYLVSIARFHGLELPACDAGERVRCRVGRAGDAFTLFAPIGSRAVSA
jgi:hypothetical protein